MIGKLYTVYLRKEIHFSGLELLFQCMGSDTIVIKLFSACIETIRELGDKASRKCWPIVEGEGGRAKNVSWVRNLTVHPITLANACTRTYSRSSVLSISKTSFLKVSVILYKVS